MEVGDRVRVIKEDEGINDRKIGEPGIIKKMDESSLPFLVAFDTGGEDWCREDQLQLIETSLKYKLKDKHTPITLSGLRAKNPCANKFAEFVKLLILEDIGYAASTKTIPLELVIKLAMELGEIRWLIDNGFIVEDKPEVFYKRGDRFGHKGKEFILAQSNHKSMALICLEDGNRFTNSVIVKEPLKITYEEMIKIGAGKIDDFIKIEE